MCETPGLRNKKYTLKNLFLIVWFDLGVLWVDKWIAYVLRLRVCINVCMAQSKVKLKNIFCYK